MARFDRSGSLLVGVRQFGTLQFEEVAFVQNRETIPATLIDF